jgi:O-antigen ligase
MIYIIYIGGALAFSVATVLALGTAMEFERRWRALMVPALYLLIFADNCVVPPISGRDLLSGNALAAPGTAGKWFTRFIIVSTLLICAARMVAAAFSRENRGARGAVLFVAFCVYFLTSAVLTSALGTHPQFKHDFFYVPFLFAAVYASRTQDPELALRFAKVGLFIFILESCLVSLVAPELTIERNYHSWIPGVTIRFWGLETHANSMAPLALVYLLVSLHQPFERRWLQRLGLILGVGVLLFAQSKTTLTAAAITIPLLLVVRSGAWRTAAFSLLSLGGVIALALLLLPALGVSLEGLSETQQGYEASRFTGRDVIWSLAVQEWMRNPLFGYGISMWNETYRMQIGMDHAVSAHNQFLQTLSVAGTMGLIGLVVYLGVLVRWAIRAARPSRGLSVGLLILVLLRCVTETPLQLESFLSGAFVTQLLLFHVALGFGQRVPSVARAAALVGPAGRTA